MKCHQCNKEFHYDLESHSDRLGYCNSKCLEAYVIEQPRHPSFLAAVVYEYLDTTPTSIKEYINNNDCSTEVGRYLLDICLKGYER